MNPVAAFIDWLDRWLNRKPPPPKPVQRKNDGWRE